MSYVDKNLIPGESILYRTGLHWVVLVWPLLLAEVLGVPATYVVLMLMKSRSAYSDPAGLVGLCVSVLGVTAVLAGILRRSTTEMAVTNKRVVVKTGILSRRTYGEFSGITRKIVWRQVLSTQGSRRGSGWKGLILRYHALSATVPTGLWTDASESCAVHHHRMGR